MLKDYLKHKKITRDSFAKENNISYRYINDMADNVINPQDISTGLFRKIASALGISMDELYIACTCSKVIYSKDYANIGFISENNGQFILDYFYDSKHYNKTICKIDEDSSYFIECMALWDMEKKLSDLKSEELQYELLFKTEK